MFQKETFFKKENVSLFPSFSGESAVSFFCNQIEWFNLKDCPLHKSSMKAELYNKELISDIKHFTILTSTAPKRIKQSQKPTFLLSFFVIFISDQFSIYIFLVLCHRIPIQSVYVRPILKAMNL